jgi:taurine transport system substrate-binding protein
MNEANMAYLADPAAWTADSDPVKKIAEMTGAAPDQVPNILKGFTFIPLADQMGGHLAGRCCGQHEGHRRFPRQGGSHRRGGR